MGCLRDKQIREIDDIVAKKYWRKSLKCLPCKGTGEIKDKKPYKKPCKACGSRGVTKTSNACPKCKGKKGDMECKECYGSGNTWITCLSCKCQVCDGTGRGVPYLCSCPKGQKCKCT